MSVTAAPLAAGLRPLTADDAARLHWLREQLRSSRADVSTPAGLGALVEASHAGWVAAGAQAVPEGMLASLSVGLGDLLVGLAPGATWVMHAGQGSPSPAVVDASGEAVVLPFADLRSRWVSGRSAWVPGYVDAAAAHLRHSGTDVPRQRPVAPDAAAAPVADEARSGGQPGPGAHAVEAARPGPATEPAPTPGAIPAVQAGAYVAPVPPAAVGGGQLPSRVRANGPAQTLPVADGAGPAVSAGSGPASADENPARPSASAGSPRPASPADLASPPSPRVQDLVLRALEAALDEVVAGGHLLPFALVPRGSSWHLEHPETGGVEAARAWVSTSGATHGAVAWTQVLDGEAAVYAEACEAGTPGLVVAHRYVARQPVAATGRRHSRPRVAEPVGDLVLVGQSAPML